MRAAKLVLIVCLLCLATTVFADIFPLTPPPDVFINQISFDGSTLVGTAQSITDVSGTFFFGGGMLADSSGTFLIFGTDPSDVYLLGTILNAVVQPGGEAGLLISVQIDDNAKWSALEGTTASSFGPLVAFNIHNLNIGDDSPEINDDRHDDDEGSGSAFGDLAPLTATPEPASLTLVIGGIATGLLRKKLSGKK